MIERVFSPAALGSALLLLLFVSPDNTAGNLIQGCVFVLFVLFSARHLKIDLNLGTLIFIPVFVLSFFYLLLNRGVTGSFEGILKSLLVLVFFLLFPLSFGVAYRLTPKLLTIMLALLASSQIVLMLDIAPFSEILQTVYFPEGSRHLRSVEDIALFLQRGYRSGGFLGNPNQAAKVLTLLLSCYLLVLPEKPSRAGLLFFASLYTFSLLATGSRTGFLVTAAIILFVGFRVKERLQIGLLLMSVFLGFVAMWISTGSPLRFLALSQGIEGSLGSKVRLMLNYYTSVNDSVILLFGNFLSDTARLYYPAIFGTIRFNLDADLGYFVYAFGLLGVVSLVVKLFALSRHPSFRMFLPVLFWFFSASIFFHFRFLLLFMLMASIIIHSNVIERELDDRNSDERVEIGRVANRTSLSAVYASQRNGIGGLRQ